jgi:hypothetical protein
MNSLAVKYSIPHEVYEKLVDVAKLLGLSNAFDAIDKTLLLIKGQMQSTVLNTPETAQLRETLLNTPKHSWIGEEKVLLLAEFLLSYSVEASVLRFRQFSWKDYDVVKLRLKVLATIYGMLLFRKEIYSGKRKLRF